MVRSKEKSRASHIYGPVPSRRLGFSLGVDIIPFKTCSFNCIYCQLGPTPRKTIQRREYYPLAEILSQIKKAIRSGTRIDYITFSGSGEPTLYSKIGKLIREIKKITSIPVAVLTNSSLLSLKSVRNALQAADLIVPSLDAANPETLVRINRPHASLNLERIIEGLKAFRQEFKGSIWLEVMLVKGINDSLTQIRMLKKLIAEINPDKVQLNTVVRPPAEDSAQPLTPQELKRIKQTLDKGCEIIAEFQRKKQEASAEDLDDRIYSLIKRRPVTLSDISQSLGRHRDEIIKHLNILLKKEKIKSNMHKGLKYYEPK